MNAWQWTLVVTAGLAAWMGAAALVGGWIGRVIQLRDTQVPHDEPAQAVDCE